MTTSLFLAHCNICGSTNIERYLTVKQYKLVVCKDCGLVFRSHQKIAPQRRLNESQSVYYSHKYNSRITAKPRDALASLYDWWKADLVIKFLTKSKMLLKGTKVIDIGCSVGYFLTLARAAGAKVLGIDVSPVAKQLAREMFGIEVEVGEFPNSFSLSHSKANLITFNDSFEHLLSPFAALSKAKKWLSRNGNIFIRTPDISYCKNRNSLRKWRLLQPQDHLYFFSGSSLETLLLLTGFKVIKLTRVSGWIYVLAESQTKVHVSDSRKQPIDRYLFQEKARKLRV